MTILKTAQLLLISLKCTLNSDNKFDEKVFSNHIKSSSEYRIP